MKAKTTIFVIFSLFSAIFGQLLAQGNNGAWSNSTLTTTIEVHYNTLRLVGTPAPSITLQAGTPVTAGSNYIASNLNNLTSATQYLRYTLVGANSTPYTISVQLASSLSSDAFEIHIINTTTGTQTVGTAPTVFPDLTLTTNATTWASFSGNAASGTSATNGIPYQYQLQQNLTGDYSTMHAGQIQATIIFTISE